MTRRLQCRERGGAGHDRVSRWARRRCALPCWSRWRLRRAVKSSSTAASLWPLPATVTASRLQAPAISVEICRSRSRRKSGMCCSTPKVPCAPLPLLSLTSSSPLAAPFFARPCALSPALNPTGARARSPSTPPDSSLSSPPCEPQRGGLCFPSTCCRSKCWRSTT
jgi:hypothetical protein